MKRVAILASLVCAGAAMADKFEELAQEAIPVDGPAAVGALFWAPGADCGRTEDDLLRRACEQVKRARTAETQNKTFLVRADAGGISSGDWDAARSELAVEIHGCVACVAPVVVGAPGDARRFVVTRGASTIAGNAFIGPTLAKTPRRFPNDTTAFQWKADVAPRLRTELLVKIPAQLEQVGHGDTTAFTMELVGWRTFDPCDGTVLASSPASGPVPADRSACKGGAPATNVADDGHPKDDLPYDLSSTQIKKGMDSLAGDLDTCLQTYGVTGTADLRVDISSDGHVANVDLKGDFVDTPTGDCVVRAVKKVQFPSFKRATMSVHYPILLR